MLAQVNMEQCSFVACAYGSLNMQSWHCSMLEVDVTICMQLQLSLPARGHVSTEQCAVLHLVLSLIGRAPCVGHACQLQAHTYQGVQHGLPTDHQTQPWNELQPQGELACT